MTDFGGVSLKPSDAQAGGGLFDDLDVRLKKVYFRLWDYNGSIASPVLGLGVVYERLDDEGGEFEQVYSAGDLKFLVPSADGSEAVPVNKDDRSGLGDGTNAIQFLMSLVNVGFPEVKIGKKVTVFEGTCVHVNRVPQQKRAGIKSQDSNKKNDILVATKLISLPGESPAGQTQHAASAGTAGKGKKAAAPAVGAQAQAPAEATQGSAPADDAITNRAIEVVMQILGNKGGSIPKAQIAGEAFAILNLAKDPLRNQVSQIVFKDVFLQNGPWSFDGTTISLG